MDIFITSETLISFLTLVFLETILGIDNLIFVQIITANVDHHYQKRVRRFGLLLALLLRIVLMTSIAQLVNLTYPLLSIMSLDISWKDLILLGGGLFLIAKGTIEIHRHIENTLTIGKIYSCIPYGLAIIQIATLDVIFSLDSIITAVGITKQIPVMIGAMTCAMGVMIFAVDGISTFVQRHRTVKMLALTFLILIGLSLILEAFDFYIPKGYLYFAILFSIGVEALNLITRKFLKFDEEVKTIIEEGTKKGDFYKTEEKMLIGVMKLGDKPIKAFMTLRPHLEWIDINATQQELLKALPNFKASRLLIGHKHLDEIVGIIYLKDLMKELVLSPTFSLTKLIKKPAFVPSTMQALGVLEHFNYSKINMVIVVDEWGNIEGVATATDILEAIVGELNEQNLDQHNKVIQQKDGSWIFDGEVPIELFKNTLKLSSELTKERYYYTLAGFIIYHLRTIPKKGQSFRWEKYRIEILAMQDNKIKKILVTYL